MTMTLLAYSKSRSYISNSDNPIFTIGHVIDVYSKVGYLFKEFDHCYNS